MLRQYQEEALEDLRRAIRSGDKRILFEASVGWGKSVAIQCVSHGYAKSGRPVLVLSNRTAVVDQLRKRAAGSDLITATTVQAADWRLDKLTPPAVILADEIHMGGAAAQYGRVFGAFPDAIIIGFTGTPKPETFDTFPCHVKARGARWLTEKGFLAPLRYVCPDPLDLSRVAVRGGEYDEAQVMELLQERRLYADALETYRTHGRGVPTLGFCVNVKHATDTADEFRKAGHACEVLTGKDRPEEVQRKIACLADGGLCFSVDKVSAGFDMPDLRVLLSLRPTKSEQLWVQQLGRAARASDGKPFGLVLDHVGNTLRLGTLTEERDWRASDEDKAQRTTETGDSLSVRQCGECMAAFESGPSCCPDCGASLAKETRIPRSESVRLREMQEAEIEAQRKAAAEAAAALRARLGQSIPQMRAWIPARTPGQAHRKAVDNMRGRLDRALRDGDEELEAFCRDQLRRFGGGR